MWNRLARLSALVTVAAMLLLAGCAGSGPVRLGYDADRWSPKCEGVVGLHGFEDARPTSAFVLKDGKALETDKDVAQWVTQALCDELEARSFTVTQDAPDSPFAPEVNIGGEVLRAVLDVDGVHHTMQMTLHVVVQRGKEVVLDKTYAGQWDRQDLPTRGTIEEMASSALVDMLSSVMADIHETLHG
ncbi:hypothetical protein JCM16814_26240 [Desulfobaculum senezii]